jgi:hypothetical protein
LCRTMRKKSRRETPKPDRRTLGASGLAKLPLPPLSIS